MENEYKDLKQRLDDIQFLQDLDRSLVISLNARIPSRPTESSEGEDQIYGLRNYEDKRQF